MGTTHPGGALRNASCVAPQNIFHNNLLFVARSYLLDLNSDFDDDDHIRNSFSLQEGSGASALPDSKPFPGVIAIK
jgi:hypothetical protein